MNKTLVQDHCRSLSTHKRLAIELSNRIFSVLAVVRRRGKATETNCCVLSCSQIQQIQSLGMIKWSIGSHSVMLTGHYSGIGNSAKALEKLIDIFCASVVGQSCAKFTDEGIYTAGK
jgi:hypothetical protein